MTNPWQPISTAPRCGREIELTWMDNGKPQEIYPMRWNRFASNHLVQPEKGIWAMHSQITNEILTTWTEEDPDGAPTHWREIEPKPSRFAADFAAIFGGPANG